MLFALWTAVSVQAQELPFYQLYQSLTDSLDERQASGERRSGDKALRLWCEDQAAFSGPYGSLSEGVANAYKGVFAEPGGKGPKIAWNWQNLGPNQQPFELNPGGRAIPAYAENRGNGTGRINCVFPDPFLENRVFACSPTGGLFVSEDAGLNWRNAGTDALPISGVSSITVDPNDPDRWIISTGDGDDNFMFSDGLWRTEDGGESYVNINGKRNSKSLMPTEDPTQYLYISEVLAHPCSGDRVFVASNNGLYQSDNVWDEVELIRWERVAEGSFYDLYIDPQHPSVVLAGGSRFFRSNDCGATWEEQAYPRYKDKGRYPFSRLVFQAMDKTDGVFVGLSCSERPSQSAIGPGALWYYDLRSREWTEIRSLKNGMDNYIPTRARAFAVHPDDEEMILVANVQPVFKSTDGGLNFKPIAKNQMHDDVHHLVWSPDRSMVWAAHDGGVSVSFDNGDTWVARDLGIGAANVFGLSVGQTQAHQVLFGAYDTGGNLLIDSLWYHVTWGDGFETIIDRSNPDIMFATKQNGHINRSDNRGLDFENVVTSGKTKTEWHTWIRPHTLRGHTLFCAGDKLIRSKNYGEDWDVILDTRELEGEYNNVFRIFTSEDHPEVLYAYVLDKSKIQPALYRTFNAGSNDPTKVRWEEVQKIPKDGWISYLVVDADNPRQFWMAYKTADPSGKIYRFNGNSYLDVTVNLGWCIVLSMAIDKTSEERLYVGTNHGVFTRNKREKDWTLLQGLPGAYVRSIDLNYERGEIYVGTYGRGVWHAPLYNPEP